MKELGIKAISTGAPGRGDSALSPPPKGALRVTILGSGTSTGVPVIGCECPVCLSQNPKNNRTRCSIMLTFDTGKRLVIDTGPDFRQQMLRHRVKELSHIFYTHTHADHCHGFDDIRAFYFHGQMPMHCYVPRIHVEEFKRRFHYAFFDLGYMGTRPQVVLHSTDEGLIKILGMEFETTLLPHGGSQTMAFRLGTFVYATDFKAFPDELKDRWRGQIHTLVASGVRYRPLPTHSTIGETTALMMDLGVKRGVITHLNHDVDHDEALKALPAPITLAYDGLTFDVPSLTSLDLVNYE